MIQKEDFSPFNPLTMRPNTLPAKPGNYLIVLRGIKSLPQCTSIEVTPQLTSIEHNGEYYTVIYVEKVPKSIRESYKKHFQGTAETSTIRKSIGYLMGFKPKPNSIQLDSSLKKTFTYVEEKHITEWMEQNLLILYYANNDYKNTGQELMTEYNPPLNLQGNFYKINAEYRKQLSELRKNSNMPNSTATPENTFSHIKWENIIKNKKVVKWGIAIILAIFLSQFSQHEKVIDRKAIYIVNEDHKAPIDEKAAEELIHAAVDDDKMKTLEILGSRQRSVFFYKGDQVRIIKRKPMLSACQVQRLSDGASAVILNSKLTKE